MTEWMCYVLKTTKNIVRIHFRAIFNARCSLFIIWIQTFTTPKCHYIPYDLSESNSNFFCTWEIVILLYVISIEYWNKRRIWTLDVVKKKVSYERVDSFNLYHKSHWKVNEWMPVFLFHLPLSFPFHSKWS